MMTNLNKIAILIWALIVGWIIVILFLSSQTGNESSELTSGISKTLANIFYKQANDQQIYDTHILIRKFAHIAVFSLLSVLVNLALICSFCPSKTSSILVLTFIAFVITFAVGFYDEWHKQFVAGRHFDITEVWLNAIGAFLGAMVVLVIYLFIKKR